LIESSPPNADLYDQDGLQFGRTPFSVDPNKEKSVVVRWRGRFSSTIDLTNKTGTLTANPDLSGGPTKEPLLAQLENPALALNKEVMAKIHQQHSNSLSSCEYCHAAEMALDGFLCQSCHQKDKKDLTKITTKIIATDPKQCTTCHLDGFKPPNKKFHLMGK
jgi:hypothetical protein